jgi:hypothetical protein
MAQKQISVTATNGSAVVTLSDTSGIVAGKSIFQRSDDGVPGAYPSTYIVDSIVADTSVTLTGNYGGDSGTFTGLFTVDFSANHSLPYFYSGDLNTPEVLNRLIAYLDANLVLNGADVSLNSIVLGSNFELNGNTSNQFRNNYDNTADRNTDFNFPNISTVDCTIRINRATNTTGGADVVFHAADGSHNPQHTFDKSGNYTLEGAIDLAGSGAIKDAGVDWITPDGSQNTTLAGSLAVADELTLNSEFEINGNTTNQFRNNYDNSTNRNTDFNFPNISTVDCTVRVNRATNTTGDADVIFYGADGTNSPQHTFSKNGNYALEGQVIPGSFTVATLPAGENGGMIYVSDETDGACNAVYDGSNWVRIYDQTTVS